MGVLKWACTTLVAISAWGCTAAPQGVEVVTGLELQRYLGTWYEIARLDHAFERGLERVSATYTRREDGGITVLNRGFNPEQGTWKEAEGRAYPLNATDPSAGASLKVTFFWPFYAGYHIIALDKDQYTYAMVCGPKRDYLWILARQPVLDPDVLNRLIDKAAQAGFAVEDLIMVRHPGGAQGA